MIGSTLSHHKIVSELVWDGLGIVHEAQKRKLDQTLAIKILVADRCTIMVRH